MQSEVTLGPRPVPFVPSRRLRGWLLFALSNFFEGLAILLLAAEVVVVGLAVFTRYALNQPIAGSDELATLVLVWLTFIGGAVATRRRAHLSVNLLVQQLPLPVQHWLEAVVEWLSIGMLLVLSWQSLLLVQRRGDQVSPGFGYNLGLLPLPLAVGAIGMMAFILARLVAMPRRQVVISGTIVWSLLGILGYVGLALGWDLTTLPALPALLAGFVVLLLANAPLLLALGLPSVGYLFLLGGSNLIMFPQIMVGGTQNFVLLAIPLFIVAGVLMETGGISARLVNLAMALVGHLRGGLAQVCVVAEILFSGISGSTVADVTAIGSVLLPSMRRAGYSKEDAVSIVSAASAMGILVPPALLMVILGAMANLSVTALFLAGFLPALVLAAGLMLLIYVQAGRKNWPTVQRASWHELGKAFLDAIIPMMMPVLIFGSIFSGAATVTEAAALAVVYALVVGVFVYREITPKDLPKMFLESSVMTSVSMWVVGVSSLFTWLLARQQVPDAVAAWILSISSAQWFFIVASILLFTLFGALLEGFPAAIILGPIFYPIASQLGVDLIHYSIIIVASVGIGLFLPPVGIGLFIATAMGRTTMSAVMRPFAPYLVVLLATLVLVGLIPWVTLVVPQTFLSK